MVFTPPKLILIEPTGTRRELTLSKLPFTIGRQAGNDLLLRDTRISRQHAAIVVENGRFVVEDRGSRHGTYVNGARVERRVLQHNDRIEFGPQSPYALIFSTGESPLPELLRRVETPLAVETPARELRSLNLLLEVGQVLQAGLPVEEILGTVVDAALRVSGAERGFLFLKNESGQLEFRTGRDRTQRYLDEQAVVSRSVLDEVLRNPRDLLLTHSQTDPRFSAQESIVGLNLQSILCLPLRRFERTQASTTTVVDTPSDVLGVLYLDSRKPVAAFSETDRQVLHVLAAEAAAVIENARLMAAAQAKERLEQELAIARTIQQALLPKGFKEYPFFQVTALTLPCEQVGGDYFDLIEIPGDRYGFVVADVSGKGVSAALLTSMLQGAFSASALLGQPPESIASQVNRFICGRAEVNRFATLFYGMLESDGTFTYVNAGHLPPLMHHRTGSLEGLLATSFPLGLFSEADYAAARCHLKPGDTLVLYSDGITEATSPEGEFFGLARLEAGLNEYGQASVEELSQHILDAVTRFTAGSYQADDMTLMVLRYQGNP